MAEQTKKLSKFEIKLQEQNKAFNKSSRTKKRLLVLEDVLKISRSKKFKITHGIYGTFRNYKDDISIQQNFLKVPDFSCQVCAKGALFCSRVRLGNEVDIDLDSSLDHSETIDALEGIFEEREMDMFESVFEENEVDSDNIPEKYKKELEKQAYDDDASDYLKEFYPEDGPKRFILMVENIIWAKGNVDKGLFRYLYEKPRSAQAIKELTEDSYN